MGEDDSFIDLLFYHIKLRGYVVIELKATDFKPEHAGQLSFYLTAVDRQIKSDQDNPTIGLLLCRKQNRLVAEYALSAINQPIGVAEYRLTQAIPPEFQGSLPTIEQLESELQGENKPIDPLIKILILVSFRCEESDLGRECEKQSSATFFQNVSKRSRTPDPMPSGRTQSERLEAPSWNRFGCSGNLNSCGERISDHRCRTVREGSGNPSLVR